MSKGLGMSKKKSVKNTTVNNDKQEVQKDEKTAIVDKAMETVEKHKNGLIVGCCMAAAATIGAVIGHFVFSPKSVGYSDTIVAATLDSDYDDEDDEDDDEDDD